VVHEVEEVAALLDEGAAGVAVEAVPVADLHEEGEPVLADRHHPRGADRAAVHLLDEAGDRRHVAVLEAHPDHRVAPARSAGLGGVDHGPAVGDGRAQRLLDEEVEVGGEHVVEDRPVGHVRARHDDGVDQSRRQQLAVVLELDDLVAALVEEDRGLPAGCVRVGDGGDRGARHVVEVPQVLEPHHPRPDDPVADDVAPDRCHPSILAEGPCS
jgi:hypothetical protein